MLKAGTAARRRTIHWDAPRSPAATREFVSTLLVGVGERLAASSPEWIGHVKIMLTSGSAATYGSLTAATDRPHWAGALTGDIADVEMTVYAAIYSLTDAQVAQAVDETLAAEQIPA
jgi:hypothetical protein